MLVDRVKVCEWTGDFRTDTNYLYRSVVAMFFTSGMVCIKLCQSTSDACDIIVSISGQFLCLLL